LDDDDNDDDDAMMSALAAPKSPSAPKATPKAVMLAGYADG
jgi:hypothetical protein